MERVKKVKKQRIIEIDFIRGVLIWLMVVDHIFYDFIGVVPNFFTPYRPVPKMLFDIGILYWDHPARIIIRYVVLALFFLICGISTFLSRNSLKRGLIIFGVGVLVSIAFTIFGIASGSGTYVLFGAITCFGLSVILFSLFKMLFKSLFPDRQSVFKYVVLLLGILFVVIGICFNCYSLNGPISERVNGSNFMLIILGYRQDGGASDWCPLFPYLGYVFIGAFLGEVLYKEKKSLFKPLSTKPTADASAGTRVFYYSIVFPYKGLKHALSFSGKYSLFFYLLHQVVIILIMGVILLCLGYNLNLG